MMTIKMTTIKLELEDIYFLFIKREIIKIFLTKTFWQIFGLDFLNRVFEKYSLKIRSSSKKSKIGKNLSELRMRFAIEQY